MRHSKGELRERERKPKLTRYKVYVQQYVEQVTEIEIDAETPEHAIDRVLSYDGEYIVNATWEPGDDCYDADVYMVKDSEGNEVWER